MTSTFSAWLAGPAATVLGVGLTEDGDKYTIAAQVKYGKIRRLPEKEGFFDATNAPFDVIDAGTYAERLIAAQAKPFSDMASAWLQEAVRGIPNRVRLAVEVRCTRNDADPDGLVIDFCARGDGLPEEGLHAATFEDFRAALLAAFPDSKS